MCWAPRRARGMRNWYLVAATYIIAMQFQALAIADRLLYGEWDGKGGTLLTQSLNILFFLACIALFVRGLANLGLMRNRIGAIVLLVVILFASIGWSIDPAFTSREAILFTMTMIGMIGIAANLDANTFMSLIARISLVAAIVSLCLYFAAPQTVIGFEGDFRGVFSQKNVLGQAMMVGALGFLHRLRVGHGGLVGNVLGFVIISVACAMSKSTTSALIIVMAMSLNLILSLLRKGGLSTIFGITLMVVAVPAAIVIVTLPSTLFELVGKDSTLTGRTEIWQFVLQMIGSRPILGWGYLAFWTMSNPYAIELNNMLNWLVPQAHNGILEIALHLGVVGVVIFVGLWLHTVILGVRCLRVDLWPIGVSTVLACAAILLLSVSETVLVIPFQATNPLFFVLGLMGERVLREAKWLPSFHFGEAIGPQAARRY